MNLRFLMIDPPSSYTATIVMDVSATENNFFSKTSDTTAWLSLQMQAPNGVNNCNSDAPDGSNINPCNADLFALPSTLWTERHTLYCDKMYKSCTFADLPPSEVMFASTVLARPGTSAKRFIYSQVSS